MTTSPDIQDLHALGWRRIGHVWRAPTLTEPRPADLKPFIPAESLSKRVLSPCGTLAAYRRHSRRGEQCGACDQARADKMTRMGTR